MTFPEPPLMQWLYVDEKGKSVSSFIIEVIAKVEIHTSQGLESHVQLKLHFRGGQKEITVPLAEIDRLNWTDLDERCILNPSYPKIKLHLANVIRAGLANAKETKKLHRLDRTGIHQIDNDVMYRMGERVVTQSPHDEEFMSKIELAPLSFRLDIDTERYSPHVAFEGMRELVSLSEIGRPLLAHSISGITRAAYIAAGATPATTLEIIKDSGKFKTYYSATVTQLYNRMDGVEPVTRLESSDRFIEEILHEYSECTAVIDDKCTAQSGKLKKKNEDTAETIIRRVGDKTGRGRMVGKTRHQTNPRGNVVFTGEYPTGTQSTIARGLMVSPTTPIDGARLDKYQRKEPLIVSTFYYYYVEWYASNYNEICKELSERLTKHREIVPKIHPRLWETKFSLQSAYMLFLRFCEDSGFITAEEAKNEYLSFGTQLTSLVQAQHSRLKPDEKKSKDVSYRKLIRKLYKSDSFHLANSVVEFDPNKHDGLIYEPYGCLCIRRDSLDRKLRKIVRGAKINDAVKELVKHGALKLNTDKYVIKINGLGSVWFYGIWLDELQ